MIHPNPDTKHAYSHPTLRPPPTRGVPDVFDCPMTRTDPRRDAPAGRLYVRRAGRPCVRRGVSTGGGQGVSTHGGASIPHTRASLYTAGHLHQE
jgi:hypothetical protein